MNSMDDRYISKQDEFMFLDENNNELTTEQLRNLIIQNRANVTKKIKQKRFNRKTSTNDVINSIIGFAIGDAMGVPFEFQDKGTFSRLNPEKKMCGNMSHNQPIGSWSDDTSMVLATIDSIIESGKIDYDNIAEKFCDWVYKSENTASGVVFDIGNTTSQAIMNFVSSKNNSIDCGLKGEHNSGNGSLMRMLPIALFYYFSNKDSIEVKIDSINKVSSITHANEECKLACSIYCLFVYYLMQGYTKETAYDMIQYFDFKSYYNQQVIDKYERVLDGTLTILPKEKVKSSGYVIDTLDAAIWTVLHTNSFEDSIVEAINFGNDTDTLAAIVGSLAGILYSSENIPKEWLNSTLKIDYIKEKAEVFAKMIKNIDFKEEHMFHL